MRPTRPPKTDAERRETRRKAEAVALKRQEDMRLAALRRLQDWPKGMPALFGIGCGIGTMMGLVKRDLAEVCGFDSLGDARFKITDAGRRALAEAA